MINSVLDQSRSFLSQSGVLRGGSAPRHWKRELSHHTERLATVFLTSQWVKDIAEVNPSFLDEPLFGNCLAEITSRGPREAEIEKQLSQVPPQLPRKTLLSSNPDRERSDGATLARLRTTRRRELSRPEASSGRKLSEPRSREQRDRVSQLPLQANGSLLKRFAGPALEASEQVKARSSDFSPRPRSSTRFPVPDPDQALRLHDWRRQVADRATKTWLREWPKNAHSTSSVFEGAKAEVLAPAVSNSPLLEEQWLTSPSGERASPEILVRLMSRVGFNGAPTGSAVKYTRTNPSGLGNSPPAKFPVVTDPNSARHQPLGINVPPEPGRAAGKTFERILPERYPPDTLPDANRDLFAEPAQPPATGGGEWQPASHLVPPVLRSSLPPLLPASPGSAVLPVAAETARQGALRDEVNAQEKDLGLLAAQIKRILDEEARRHGIDV